MTGLKITISPVLYELFDRFSDWSKLLTSVAWLCKFKAWIQNRKRLECKRLTMEDLALAKRTIVSLVQRQSFPDELQDLERNYKGVKKSSSIVKFKLMLCEHGILRVSGRISEAPSTFDSKHQMILPQNNHVTTLIIRYYHQQLGHCGQEMLLSQLREEFWIIKGRARIKQVIGKCIACTKQYALQMTQEMAKLPKERLKPFEPPFTNTGIDFFGPLMIKHGRGSAKRCGCIFVCMASRAIHLELAQTLDTNDFIREANNIISRHRNRIFSDQDDVDNFVDGYSRNSGILYC